MNLSSAISAYFRHAWSGINRREVAFVAVTLFAATVLTLVPTGFERKDDVSVRARARIVETINDGVRNYGVIMQGEQIALVRVLNGPYRGVEAEANNILYGKGDLDKLYRPSGFENLDLTGIFLAGTFLASSGAIMDLAIDVAVAMEEVHKKRPELKFMELVTSGFTVGRKVFGTMTTTLLLAYTGGFTSLLMVFMAQGVPIENMFTMSYVSSEMFHTMIGSLGLVFIAPFTAVLAAALYSREPRV